MISLGFYQFQAQLVKTTYWNTEGLLCYGQSSWIINILTLIN
jgi:hypothetical protein